MGINFAVIGVGKSVTDTIRALEAYNDRGPEIKANICLVLLDARNKTPTKTFDYPTIDVEDINSESMSGMIKKNEIDYLLSVNNHQILSAKTIESVRGKVLNLHNALLPLYGGVNACAWAIYNGEVEHGITWHIMASKIDSGDVIKQVIFPIDDQETTIKLIMKCINIGITALEEILPSICKGEFHRVSQDASKRLYYSFSDIPSNGLFDFNWNYIQADRYMRCVNVKPFKQMLPYAKTFYNQKELYITKITKCNMNSHGVPGTIQGILDDGIIVALEDCIIKISHVLNSSLQEISIKELVDDYSIKSGESFRSNEEGLCL